MRLGQRKPTLGTQSCEAVGGKSCCQAASAAEQQAAVNEEVRHLTLT